MRSIGQHRRLTQRGAAMIQIMMLVGLMGLVAGAAALGVDRQLSETARSGDESMEASTLGKNRGVFNEAATDPSANLGSQSSYTNSKATSDNKGDDNTGDGTPCLKADGTPAKAGEPCSRGFWESLVNVTVSGVKSVIVGSDDYNRAGGEGIKESVSDMWDTVTTVYDCATSEECRDTVVKKVEDGYECATDTECIKETANKVADWADKAVDQFEKDVIAASDVVDSGDQKAIDEMHGKFVGKVLTEVAVTVVGGGVAKGLKVVAKLPGKKPLMVGDTDIPDNWMDEIDWSHKTKKLESTEVDSKVIGPGEHSPGTGVNTTPDITADTDLYKKNSPAPDDAFVYVEHGRPGYGVDAENAVDLMEQGGLAKNQPVYLGVCHGGECVARVDAELRNRGHDNPRVIGNTEEINGHTGVPLPNMFGGGTRGKWIDSNPNQVGGSTGTNVARNVSPPVDKQQMLGGKGVVKTDDIRFSQRSVNGEHELTENMKGGWDKNSAPVDVVERADGKLTSVDNTRVLAAQRSGITEVPANVHKGSDKLTPEQSERFTIDKKNPPTTWGEAVDHRVKDQGSVYKNTYPDGSHTIGSRDIGEYNKSGTKISGEAAPANTNHLAEKKIQPIKQAQ